MNPIATFSFSHSTAALCLIVFLEQAGLPVPAAPSLLAAGALCATGEAQTATIGGLAVLACVLADSIWFFIGRRGGNRAMRLICRLGLFNAASLQRMERRFSRHSSPFVIVAKFVPGLSVIAPPLAGAFGMSTSRFLLLDFLSSTLYSGAYLALGALFSDQMQKITRLLDHLGLGSLIPLLLLTTGYLAVHYYPAFAKRKLSASLPLTGRAGVGNQLKTIQQAIPL
ncbi:MAG: hypothetical protein C5B50_27260 [Verrucomicrobia bacterium]|nr:MAG: hypothetical protein C5B50_27260 [Verrucomicrobiota bacterium]